jgi:NAD(P)-dependent dehydrogenase (short-subunit alcohol dehydrogenase family)
MSRLAKSSCGRRGAALHLQKALPLLSEGASVILTGSMVSIKGFAACSVYNASKAAVRSFARTWIVDLKGRDIRVNVLSPGYTDTPGLAQFMTDDVKAGRRRLRPARRLGMADDLGKAAVFLASDDSAWVTGSSSLWTATRLRSEQGFSAATRASSISSEKSS